MLFSRYGANVKIVLEMEFELGFEYIMTAILNWQEEKAYMRWINGFQEIGFEEFKKQLGVKREAEDDRSKEEILSNVKEILDGKLVM